MSSASSTVMESAVLPFGSFDWFKRQLVPTRLREIRTAIMVAGAVLCVIISMALQVPELATSAYMVFFISKESKLLTTITGVGGVIVLTIGIGATLLLYKFTYGHPELRIPGMAIALFLGIWLSLSRNPLAKKFLYRNNWFADFFGFGWRWPTPLRSPSC